MRILVLNSGSSSIKLQLFDTQKIISLASGLVESIGEESGKIKLTSHITNTKKEMTLVIKDHEAGLQEVQKLLKTMGILESLEEVDGIGHRVVQGGDKFTKPTLITDEVIRGIDKLSSLAPLHNPAHLSGMRTALKQAPKVPQVAIFDTSFHQSIPQHAYMYAIDYEMYEKLHVRKYGFHGTSHYFVAKEAAKYLNIPFEKFNAITLHLGNGASACAIQNGKSIDTSMGLTPLDGLVMGTRCGDIDPSVIHYIAQESNHDIEWINNMLNKQSGLKGICGTNDARDMQELIQKGDKKAKLAFDMTIYRIKKYIGSYIAILGNIDALIFTGGIGENYKELRSSVCQNLEHFGIGIDEDKNNSSQNGIINLTKEGLHVKTLRVPTNEELEIALQTKEVIEKR